MRIVAIADTHDQHSQVSLPDGDVLVHAGDFTFFGEGAEDALNWFGDQSFRKKFFVLGNHEEGMSQEKMTEFKQEARKLNLHNLEEQSETIDEIKFGTELDNDLNVLVTHQPPKGILDKSKKKQWSGVDVHARDTDPEVEHLGDAAFRQLGKRARIDLHIFGHVHSGYGEVKRDGIHYVNCSLAGSGYELTNDPMVIDL